MRAQSTPNDSGAAEVQEFLSFLLKVGEGRRQGYTQFGRECVTIPNCMIVKPQENEAPTKVLIGAVYGDVVERFQDNQYYSRRAILTPLNVNVQAINNDVMDRLSGEMFEYLSINSIEEEASVDLHMFPVEFLDTLDFSGMPPHKLRLNVGAPIMLLRNINGEPELSNGTRLQVHRLQRHCIDAVVMTGSRQGNVVLIPRIPLVADEANLPFKLCRQFPVQVAIGMTIDRAQGQTVHQLGYYLPQEVFAHGQLYVTLSIVTSRNNIKVLIDHSVHEEEDGVCVKNAVYPVITGSRKSSGSKIVLPAICMFT